jgi:hypothetical protein
MKKKMKEEKEEKNLLEYKQKVLVGKFSVDFRALSEIVVKKRGNRI